MSIFHFMHNPSLLNKKGLENASQARVKSEAPPPNRTLPKHNALTTVTNQQETKFLQTVNHVKVVWDCSIRPKGILGGHVNVKSLPAKAEQIEKLLMGSSLDFVGPSETWLTPMTPTGIFNVPDYNVFRLDRTHGKGGGIQPTISATNNSPPFNFVHTSNLQVVKIQSKEYLGT